MVGGIGLFTYPFNQTGYNRSVILNDTNQVISQLFKVKFIESNTQIYIWYSGVALSNSPSGLAAYILEKFSSWTNLEWKDREDGGLVPYFDLDELLDNIMIYWITNSITSAIRMHAESFGPKAFAWNLDKYIQKYILNYGN